MTAINVIQTRDAVHFFSDTAFVDPDGDLALSRSKIIPLPLACCAVGVSGRQSILDALTGALSISASIEQVVEDIRFVLPRLLPHIASEPGGNFFGIYVAGFTAAGERQFWKIEGTVAPAEFHVIRCDADCWHYSHALNPQSLRAAIGEQRAQQFEAGIRESLSVRDPVEHGLLALEAQRRIPTFNLVKGKPLHIVGGCAMHTVVTAEAIEQRILKRWDDVIGRQIAGLTGYKDSSGIASGSSSNYTLDTSGGNVAPSVTAGSLLSGSGTNIGNLTSGGGLAAAFDGTTSQARASSAALGASNSGYNNTVGKDWGSGNSNTVGRFKFWGTSDEGLLATLSTGYKLQGSNDNSTWVDLYTGTVPSGAGGVYDITTGITTTTAYRYHRFNIQGNGANSAGVAEVQFYGLSTTNNMTLVTTAQTPTSAASNARVLMEIDDSASPTLNTDITVEVTCNGGTNWSSATLSSAGRGQAGRLVVETPDTACTSGSSVQARVKTFNGKSVPIYGTTIQWH